MPQTFKRLSCFIALLLVNCLFIASSFAQEGTLDATFGNNGRVTTDFQGPAASEDIAFSVAIQPDKKIVVGGCSRLINGRSFAIARYLQNGELDNSFGNGGKLVTSFYNSFNGAITAIKLQKDGKIVAAGYADDKQNPDIYYVVLVRYKPDGSLDSTFALNGKAITTIDGKYDTYNAITIQDDGKIIATGQVNCGLLTTRYKSNGDFDSTFGLNGKQITTLQGCGAGETVMVDKANRIVVAGYQGNGGLICRYKNNGSFDSAFGANGFIATSSIKNDVEFSSALLSDGKILIGGRGVNNGQYYFGLASYTENGGVDSSFGSSGVSLVNFGTNPHPLSIALQKDGKIVFGGFDATSNELILARFKVTGAIDSTFGNNGKAITSGVIKDQATSVAIQADDKIVVCGDSYDKPSDNYSFLVLRFNATSTLPITLTSFTATPAKSTAVLNWSTATETNNNYFSIERSGNSKDFNAIGRVASKGNGSQLQQYEYVDAHPLKGDNYYRLKQLDKDGRYSYSKIVRLTFGIEPFLRAYPNPAKNIVKISGLVPGATLSITAMTGKAMGQHTAIGTEYTLNIQSLPAGVYFIKVQQDGKTTTLKVVKE